MEFKLFILAGILAVSSSITISPNGNSPERKMIRGGMMIDAQKGLNPAAEVDNKIEGQTNYEKSRKTNLNVTKLSLNERYRRLIPYMTFYYANDVASPSTEPYSTDNVEVQKVHIDENPHALRDAKKINIPPNRYIPRYQGNRLTQHNIASANPTSAIKSAYQTHSYVVPTKATPNYNPLYLEQSFMNGHTFGRTQAKHRPTVPSHGFRPSLQYQTRKPYQNLFHADDSSSVKYYESDKEPSLKYKLVPYEQTAPVQVAETPAQNYNYYDRSKSAIPVPVLTKGNNHVYAETRPRVPPVAYDNGIVQQPARHFHSNPATESYYEQRTPGASVSYEINPKFPAAESGFRPIIPTSSPTAIESVAFVQSTTAAPPPHNVHGASLTASQNAPQEPDYTASFVQPEYYDYVPQSQHGAIKYSSRDSATLSDILTTLQKSNSIPQPITKENVGSSIRTLLQVLSALKAASHDSHYNDVDVPILSTPKPFSASPKIIIENDIKPELPSPEEAERATEIAGEQYLAPVNVPSQHLDHDYRGSSQAFPLAIASEDDGGTPGRAGVDYPTLTTIPPTSFDCKTQRYKGFFADPDTKCQVWHYCDLNGGQASFLCPNGTIFSQAALTCDWWFNVRCDSTHQLYVLNERLYKYILPHSPTFPEDYSGPLVDKYLTIKFKEMEEQFRKNKKKQSGAADESEVENEEAGSRADTEEEEKDLATNSSLETENGAAGNGAVSEASVVVESPGNSGTVQHLED